MKPTYDSKALYLSTEMYIIGSDLEEALDRFSPEGGPTTSVV